MTADPKRQRGQWRRPERVRDDSGVTRTGVFRLRHVDEDRRNRVPEAVRRRGRVAALDVQPRLLSALDRPVRCPGRFHWSSGPSRSREPVEQPRERYWRHSARWGRHPAERGEYDWRGPREFDTGHPAVELLREKDVVAVRTLPRLDDDLPLAGRAELPLTGCFAHIGTQTRPLHKFHRWAIRYSRSGPRGPDSFPETFGTALTAGDLESRGK